MKTVAFTISMTLLILAGGCASQDVSATSSAQRAECLVCKRNADLACVDIPVTANTARTEYAGQEYYFCSDDCRDAFGRKPSMYVSK